MRRIPRAGVQPLTFCAFALVLSGCTLVSPGCRNRDVKAALENDARASAEMWMRTYAGGDERIAAFKLFQLKDAYETSASGDTRSCSATMVVSDGSLEVPVAIEYQVVKGEGGQPMYVWEAAAFGKSFLPQAALLVAISPKLSQPTEEQPTQPTSAAPPSDRASDAPTPRKAAAVRPQDSPWGDLVRSRILAQASTVAVPSSGSVVVSFDVSEDGDFSNVEVVRGSGNAELDAAAKRIVQQTGHIDSLYGERVVGFAMKLSGQSAFGGLAWASSN